MRLRLIPLDLRVRHESLRLCAAQRVACELAFNDPEMVRQSVILANMELNRGASSFGNSCASSQARPFFRAEDVRVRALRHEMGMEDRLDHRLQPSALAPDLIAPRHLPATAGAARADDRASGTRRLAPHRSTRPRWRQRRQNPREILPLTGRIPSEFLNNHSYKGSNSQYRLSDH